jgi:hypothetical protein
MKPLEPSQIHSDIAKFAFRHVFYWIVLAFMILWVCAGWAIFVQLTTTMVTDGAPLPAEDGERLSWIASIGIIVLLWVMIAVGLACQIWGLRYCRPVKASGGVGT